MVIKGAYLIPDAATRILSLQHLVQQADNHYPMEEGTGALTPSKHITLFWAQRCFVKTVPLDPKMNVGLTTTASGTQSFCPFCTTGNIPETVHTNIFTTHVIPDKDDDESFQPKNPVKPPTQEEEDQENGEPKTDDITTQEQPQTDHPSDPRRPRAKIVGPSCQAAPLALSPGSFVIQTHQELAARTTSQAPSHIQESLLPGLPVR